jgi:hypothetical protein
MGDVPVKYAGGMYIPHLPPAAEFATIFNDIGYLVNDNGEFEKEVKKELMESMDFCRSEWERVLPIHKIGAEDAIAVLNRLHSVVITVQTIRGLENNARVAYIRKFLTDLVENIEWQHQNTNNIRLATHCFSYVTSEIEAYAPPRTSSMRTAYKEGPPTYIPTPESPAREADYEMPVRSNNSLKLERVRATHTFPRNTNIESVEYGEVQKEGFTQIYANGALECVVTWRNRNDEVIAWPDYHTENWHDGKFQSMQYASLEYRYNSPKGRETWQSMWQRDNEWHKHATEFYLEDNWDGIARTGGGNTTDTGDTGMVGGLESRKGLYYDIKAKMRSVYEGLENSGVNEKCLALVQQARSLWRRARHTHFKQGIRRNIAKILERARKLLSEGTPIRLQISEIIPLLVPSRFHTLCDDIVELWDDISDENGPVIDEVQLKRVSECVDEWEEALNGETGFISVQTAKKVFVALLNVVQTLQTEPQMKKNTRLQYIVKFISDFRTGLERRTSDLLYVQTAMAKYGPPYASTHDIGTVAEEVEGETAHHGGGTRERDSIWVKGVPWDRVERIPHKANVSTLLRQMRQLCV